MKSRACDCECCYNISENNGIWARSRQKQQLLWQLLSDTETTKKGQGSYRYKNITRYNNFIKSVWIPRKNTNLTFKSFKTKKKKAFFMSYFYFPFDMSRSNMVNWRLLWRGLGLWWWRWCFVWNISFGPALLCLAC